MLAEFGSAVTAVSASIDIQERMARFNETLDEAQRMLFRIGVHLGEVIVDDEDQNIFGDGVNLAARIQSLAEPGGIALTISSVIRIGARFPGMAAVEIATSVAVTVFSIISRCRP